MPGGSVYKDHTFNKKTAPISHENRKIHHTNFQSTIQLRGHYKTQQKTENAEGNMMNIPLGNEPGPSSL
jgi:hypothetical protein